MIAKQRGQTKEGLWHILLRSGSTLPTDSSPEQCDSLTDWPLSYQAKIKHTEPQKREDWRTGRPRSSVQFLLPEGRAGDCGQVLSQAETWCRQTLVAHSVTPAGCKTRLIPDNGEYTGVDLDQQRPQGVKGAAWDTEVPSGPLTMVTRYRSWFTGIASEGISDDSVENGEGTPDDPVRCGEDTSVHPIICGEGTSDHPVKCEGTSDHPVKCGEDTPDDPVKCGEDTLDDPVKCGEDTLDDPVKCGEDTSDDCVKGIGDTTNNPVKSSDATTNSPEKCTGNGIKLKSVYPPLQCLCVWVVQCLYVGVVLSLCVGMAAGTKLRSPGQHMSQMCLKWMSLHGNDTPSVLHLDFMEDYSEVNATCCGDFPGTDFHGQRDYDESGDQYSMIACLVTKVVPKGYTGRIGNYGTDKPYFHLLMDNEFSHRDPRERLSWQVSYPYHYGAEKSRCDGVGQEMYCRGTDGDDNRCTCQQGYKPSAGCERTVFSSNTPLCHCEKCPPGQEAWHSPVSNNKAACKDMSGLPQFECSLQSSPPTPHSPSPGPRGSPVSPGSPEKGIVSSPPGEDPSPFRMHQLVYLLAVVVVFALILLIACFKDKIVHYIGNKFNSLRSRMGYKLPKFM